MDPLSLDWGEASAEFHNEEKKTAVHIFKHDLSTPEAADRAIRFAKARVAYAAKRMEEGTTQEVWYDDREQSIPAELRKKVRDAVAPCVAALVMMSEEEA